MEPITWQPIGRIHSCFGERFATPRQPGLVPEAWARLELFPEFQPEMSLQGLEGFSHLWVIFLFHKNANKEFRAKTHPPRLGGQSVGLFASRSPYRPNPVGLSLVRLEAVEKNALIVRGGDFVEGTPVVDLKPYLPEIERVDADGGWTTSLPQEGAEGRRKVLWHPQAKSALAAWQAEVSRVHLKNLIEETLGLDPRPKLHRVPGKDFGFTLFDRNIRFVFADDQAVEVLKIEKWCE